MSFEILISSIAIIIIIFLVIYLGKCIYRDIESAIRYHKGLTCTGTILDRMEDFKIPNYGSGAIGIHKITYRQYKVEYCLNGITYYGVFRTKDKKVDIDSKVTLKYMYNTKNEPVILNPCLGDRIKELGIAAVWIVILQIICIIYFYNIKK